MASQPHFNDHYKSLLDQLPPSMKKDVWLRLINRKNKPLSEEQVRGIHPDIEELLTKEVNRYYPLNCRAGKFACIIKIIY